MESDTPTRDPNNGDEKLKSNGADPVDASSSSSDDAAQGEKVENPPPKSKFTLPSSLAWIPANFTWSHLKAVIRCSLMAWVSILFSILGEVSRPLGQVKSNVPVALKETNRCLD